MRLLLAVGLVAATLLLEACVAPPRNVSMVVGNGAYKHAPPLPNPPRDARAVSDLLGKLGWKVVTAIDQTKVEFDSSLSEFAALARDAEQVLLFYAGHGFQVDGSNYLVPVEFDARDIVPERDLISLDDSLAALKESRGQLVVILDACRDNPFDVSFGSQTDARADRAIRVSSRNSEARGPERLASHVARSGLAEVVIGARTFIAFATEPGNVALDGQGVNSPFTEALVRHLDTRNEDISRIMKRVRTEVMRETDGAQVPWDHSSLTEDFVVNRKRISQPPP